MKYTAQTALLTDGLGIVAISGGPDSTYLALALASSGCSIRLAHLDHAMRDDHQQEAAWVRRFAELQQLPLTQGALQPGTRSEADARQARYAFLERVALETGARWVATGHTADDQAETLLLRLARGAGLRGMAGISPERAISWGSSVRLVRPLLALRRDEIRRSLAEGGVAAYEDPSNADPAFARNRIRAELMPRLGPLIPRLGRLADRSREQGLRVDRLARERLAQITLDPTRDPSLLLGYPAERLLGPGARLLDREGLQDGLLPWLLEAAFGDGRPLLERDHLATFSKLRDAGAGKRLDLPGGWTALFFASWIGLARAAPEALPALPARRVGPGECVHLDPLPLTLTVESAPGPLTVRGRRPGDRLRRPEGSRPIPRLQNDLGVPAFLRAAWPVVIHDNEPIWMLGMRDPQGLVLRVSAICG